MRSLKIIIERHDDGYVAYPLGLRGVVVGEGDTFDEAIQNILRREMYVEPYEALKTLTRGKSEIKQSDISAFIDGLDVSESIKVELHNITPHNYIGYY